MSIEHAQRSSTAAVLPPRESDRAKVPVEKAPAHNPIARRRIRHYVVVTVVFALLAGGGAVGVNFWLDWRQYQSTDDAFIDGHIIAISPQVSARVLNVLVDDNQHVDQGDVLVQLDPTDYEEDLDQKKAIEASMRGALAEAQAQLEVAQSSVGEANASVEVAKTNARNAQQDYDRYTGLDPRARSQQQMDNAAAQQRSTAALARLGISETAN